MSQLLSQRFRGNFFVNLLGKWQDTEFGNRNSVPIGGFAYYISPPRDFGDILRDPFHTLIYITFVVVACGLMARFWVEISGESSKEIAKKFKE